MALDYKLARIKPLNPQRGINTKTYTVLPPKYPSAMKFEEALGWTKVPLDIADLLEDENVDGRPIFDVVTQATAMTLDRQAAEAKARREKQSFTAANPNGVRRTAADFMPKNPSPNPNFRDFNDVDPNPRRGTAAAPLSDRAAKRRVEPEPVEEESDTVGDWLEQSPPEAEDDARHPESELGDEADVDEADEPKTEPTTEVAVSTPAKPSKRQPKAGRKKHQ